MVGATLMSSLVNAAGPFRRVFSEKGVPIWPKLFASCTTIRSTATQNPTRATAFRSSSAIPTARRCRRRRPSTFSPALLGSVSGELGLRKFLEVPGPQACRDLRQGRPEFRLRPELPDAEIVISQPFWPAYLTAERIAKAPKLKLAITAGIGSDHVDLQAAIDRKLTVAEVTYCNSISVAEHVVMMILGLVRNYIPSYQWVVKKGWNIADCVARSYDLEGMTVGTVAAGRIGLAVLRRLKPFDVKLHYTDRHRLAEKRREGTESDLSSRRRVAGQGLRRGDDQLPAASRDRAPVQRQADRQDEARRLSGQHGARQDLRSGRDRAGAGERPARRLCGRRLVSAAAAARIIPGGRCRTTA